MATRVSWFRRGALMYTVGAWSIFGYIIYHASSHITPRKEEVEEQPFPPNKDSSGYETSSSTTISEHGQKQTTIYRKSGSSFSVVSTVSSKPDFVPYSIRIYNYVKSFF